MKRIVAIVLSVLMVMSLCACGNMSLGIGNYEFRKIHIDTHSYSGCLTVEKWYDNETGIEVKTTEYGAIYLSEGQYILVEENCPICAANATEPNNSESELYPNAVG